MKNTIGSLVDQAIALDRECRKIEEKLKGIEATIIEHALEIRKDEGESTDGGGWSVDVVGDSGEAAKVTQAGKSAKALAEEDADLATIRQILGASFKELYETKISYSLVKGWRDAIGVKLDTPTRRAFLKKGTKAGALKVAYATKKSASKE